MTASWTTIVIHSTDDEEVDVAHKVKSPENQPKFSLNGIAGWLAGWLAAVCPMDSSLTYNNLGTGTFVFSHSGYFNYRHTF